MERNLLWWREITLQQLNIPIRHTSPSELTLLRFLHHILYIHIEHLRSTLSFYVILLQKRNIRFSLFYRNERTWQLFFHLLSLLNRTHKMCEGRNDVLLSLNINLQCSTKLLLLRAAIGEERSASFTLWPRQWYGLSNSQDSANPYLCSFYTCELFSELTDWQLTLNH